MEQDEDFLYGQPTEEVDEPLEGTPVVDDKLEAKKLDEKDKDRKEKRCHTVF